MKHQTVGQRTLSAARLRRHKRLGCLTVASQSTAVWGWPPPADVHRRFGVRRSSRRLNAILLLGLAQQALETIQLVGLQIGDQPEGHVLLHPVTDVVALTRRGAGLPG